MNNGIVFDIEANGLLEDATEIWCVSTKRLGEENIYSYYNGLYINTLTADYIYDVLVKCKLPIIGHNIIGYDIPMIKKFYGIDLVYELGRDNIIDTLIMSQCLYPDRQLPSGCPESIKNPITNTSKKVTPHSLEAWGYRCGHKKLEIHDWRTFTPEIISRCETDVLITEQTYLRLLKEGGIINS